MPGSRGRSRRPSACPLCRSPEAPICDRDREFESRFLQQRVCELSVPARRTDRREDNVGSCPATSSFARGHLAAGMFQREEGHAAPSDFGQPKSGTDGGANVHSESENSAAATGRRRGRHGECAASRGSGLCKAAGLSDGARLMADWRSAYHRSIAARPPDLVDGQCRQRGRRRGGLVRRFRAPEAWSAVPAFRGICAATARDCTAALATGGFSTRTIFHNCRTGQAESDDGREQQGRAGGKYSSGEPFCWYRRKVKAARCKGRRPRHRTAARR